VLACPFCGSRETDRFVIEGRTFLVFGCMFSPEIEAGLTDDEIAQRLGRVFGSNGSEYFRGTCDRLHVYVTKGEGARLLDPEPRPPRP
jgi:hypothetical protein